MKPFSVVINDFTQAWQNDSVSSFVGRDASGSFGILAAHENFMTTLPAGMARFYLPESGWQYLAQPGSVLLFEQGRLYLSTTQFIISDESEKLVNLMESLWQRLEHQKRAARQSQLQIEQALTRKLWEMSKQDNAYEPA